MQPLHYSNPETAAKTDIVAIGSEAKPMKVGVLLLNLGGPETMEDVEGFLYNLFADPDIIRLPTFLSLLQKPIAYAIAKKRAPKSSAAYLSIGGGSPIVKYTKAQADLIQASLIEKGLDAKCYFAMRYWNPYTEEVLDQMQKDEINTMVVIPLYPQYSISTSGSSLKLLEDIFYNQPDKWGPDKVQLCSLKTESISHVAARSGVTVLSTLVIMLSINLNPYNSTVTLLGNAYGSTSMVFQARICANHGIAHRKCENILKSKLTGIINLTTFIYLHVLARLRLDKVPYQIYDSNLFGVILHPRDITNTSISKIQYLNNSPIYDNLSNTFHHTNYFSTLQEIEHYSPEEMKTGLHVLFR